MENSIPDQRLCHFKSYPSPVSYRRAWNVQRRLAALRSAGRIPDTILFLEHPPTITLGRKTHAADLLTPAVELEMRGIEVIETDRGGEITYHAPGQLVGYPILDLKAHGQDLHRYLRDLEETIIRTLATYGVQGERKAGLTGVWVNDRKIAAIGIKVARWVSTHGFALNISLDLTPPRRDFIPCGIRDFGVTSLQELCPYRSFSRSEVEAATIAQFEEVFGCSARMPLAGQREPPQ